MDHHGMLAFGSPDDMLQGRAHLVRAAGRLTRFTPEPRDAE